jgi:hypothetical protein
MQSEKKPYVRPELVKHGKVESLTQTAVVHGCSSPLKIIGNV